MLAWMLIRVNTFPGNHYVRDYKNDTVTWMIYFFQKAVISFNSKITKTFFMNEPSVFLSDQTYRILL